MMKIIGKLRFAFRIAVWTMMVKARRFFRLVFGFFLFCGAVGIIAVPGIVYLGAQERNADIAFWVYGLYGVVPLLMVLVCPLLMLFYDKVLFILEPEVRISMYY